MNRWHQKDQLLTGLTYEDLITAFVCNSKELTQEAMMKELGVMLRLSFEEAMHNINCYGAFVITEARQQRKANENEQRKNG